MDLMLRKDTSFSLSVLPALASDGHLFTGQDAVRSGYGAHYLAADTHRITGQRSLVVYNRHAGLGGLIFSFSTADDSNEYGTLNQAPVRLRHRADGSISARFSDFPFPVPGLAVRDRQRRYTLFVQIGEGAFTPTRMMSDGTVDGAIDIRRILNNRIGSVYLLDSLYRMKYVLHFTDSLASGISIDEDIRRMDYRKDQLRDVAGFDFSYLISLFLVCREEGARIGKAHLPHIRK
jgi:hypothetical protein